MGDHKLRLALEQLNFSLSPPESAAAARRWADDFNTQLRLLNANPPAPPPSIGMSQVLDNLGLHFLVDALDGKGLRLKFLEEALGSGRIVVTGAAPQLGQDVLEVLKGRKSANSLLKHSELKGATIALRISF
jgi:hypothetical protein